MAVNEAASGDTILVAAGTYTFDPALDVCPTSLTAVVCVKNRDLTIKGGYSSDNWLSANPQTNVTIIDGEDTNRGVLVTNITTPSSLVMEGFTVTRGLGVHTQFDDNAWGGGVYARSADLTLRNMVVENSTAQGKPNTTGVGKGATGAGGGIAVRGSTTDRVTAAFENVTCDGNTAIGGDGPERGGGGQGGCMWLYYTDATGDQLLITNNLAIAGNSADGDGVYNGWPGAQGGGIAFKEESVSTFTNLVVSGNAVRGGDTSPTIGLGGFGFGGGLYGEVATFSVTDSLVFDNTATGGDAANAGGAFGGGVYSLDSTVILERMEILTNQVTGGVGGTEKGSAAGGGTYFEDVIGDGTRTITVNNSIIADNMVVLGTGGGATVSGGGGAVALSGAQGVLTHCTLARNTLSTTPMSGRAINLINRAGTTPGNLDFVFGIISDHNLGGGESEAVRVNSGTTLNFDTGIFTGNVVDIDNRGTVNGLGSMTDPGPIDYVSPGNPSYNYHLQSTSPAIGAATASTMVNDIDGGLRQDGNPDMGADEYGAEAFLLTVTVSTSGAAQGTVTSDVPGIDCGSDCKELYQGGTVVTLTALADNASSSFTGWQGDADCDDGVVTLNTDISCTATFLVTEILSDDFESGSTSKWSATVY
jgi:hypothetical protein